MRLCLLCVALLIAATVVHSQTVEEVPTDPAPPDPHARWYGIWSTHHQQIYLSWIVLPDGEGYLIRWGEGMGFSIDPIQWKPMPNGWMTQTMPRIRVWGIEGREDRGRAEMHKLPTGLASEQFDRFPDRFFLTHRTPESMARKLDPRPLPSGWDLPTLPNGWDQTAGQSREELPDEK